MNGPDRAAPDLEPRLRLNPGLGVGLKMTGKPGQLLRMRVGAIRGEAIPSQRRCDGSRCPIVNHVSPQPARGRLAAPRIEHRNRCIIGVKLGSLQPLRTDAADDRIEQCCCLSRPPGQRRAINIDALSGHHLGLTVKRQVMIELGNDDMGQCGKGRLAARDGLYLTGSFWPAVGG